MPVARGTRRASLRLAAPAGVLGVLLVAAACGPANPPSSSPSSASPVATPVAAITRSPTPAPATSSPTPSPTALPSASSTASPRPTATPAPRATATSRPTAAPTPAGPTVAVFWDLVRRAAERAGTLEVAIAGPNIAVLRFTPRTSATVVDGVVGFVCVGGRAYDGQSGFTALPGTWTCGAPALVAGFRSIGQPIDAWSDTLPVDRGRAESVAAAGGRLTWRYRATSPYYGGAVSATVTIDAATGRVVSARREDPTGATRYTFRYGADFPPIAVPD